MTAVLVSREVAHGQICWHGKPEGCLSIRCGSDCTDHFDRMHPCPACALVEFRRRETEAEERGAREALRAAATIEVDNHHNALVCPYCTRDPQAAKVRAAALTDAAEVLREYERKGFLFMSEGPPYVRVPWEAVATWLDDRAKETP